jgi:hypothetical protein
MCLGKDTVSHGKDTVSHGKDTVSHGKDGKMKNPITISEL